MHGRLKVKTTAEQAEQKRKEREEKLKLFRKASAVVLSKIGEKVYDEDGLKVTQQLLGANSDYSSMWNYRKDVINSMADKPEDELQEILNEELSFLAFCLRKNPKSYGCWHHRCFVMLKMPKPDWKQELNLCNQFLQFDERNFHCWDYRRFVVKQSVPTVSVDDEIACTDKLVASNFSNYSSWHYRSKLLPLRYPCAENPDRIMESKLLEELELVQNAFFTDPNDQSAWFYHRWLLGKMQAQQGLIAVHCTKSPLSVTCIFRKPISQAEACSSLSLSVNDELQKTQWLSQVDGRYQQSWTCPYSKTFATENPLAISVSFNSKVVTLNLDEHSIEEHWSSDTKEVFQQQISNAKLDLLQAELESCTQLNDLEPGNKWALLTLVLLMRAIDPLKHTAETEKYFLDLKSVDPMRIEYYNDLRSKFVIEDFITQENLCHGKAKLAGKGLTRICHLQYFSSVTQLDISKNSLRSLAGPFHLLQCCEVFVAEDNEICDISGIAHMKNVKTLTLNRNHLKNSSDLESLLTCGNLIQVDIVDNKFSAVEGPLIVKMFCDVIVHMR